MPASIKRAAVRPNHPCSDHASFLSTKNCHAAICCSSLAPSPSQKPSAIAVARYGVRFLYSLLFRMLFILVFTFGIPVKPICGVRVLSVAPLLRGFKGYTTFNASAFLSWLSIEPNHVVESHISCSARSSYRTLINRQPSASSIRDNRFGTGRTRTPR